ncbi:flavin reductase family protein [Leptothoe sp. LEGE 181152]|uniref:Flavin reductase family protein n=1 Tax=Adonisia turfae CCMR0081 TaxID=2292702 RepID=A0A6M0RWJ4_9CYAN|nr:flavin reductase family protein [Adonisia turfae]MDV3353408.1 flavin reductase family protein [Leptothoe sp. LEGE 181152]NEZ60607.1 flavin reductase family protein [Adonisia turfae CCMR0081]
MEINPEALDPPSRYKLLIGTVVPRPIAFVSSISTTGKTNLAPFSYFNAVGHNPLALAFSVAPKSDGSAKDTLRNVRPVSEGGVGEYVINLAVAPYIRQVAEASEPLPYGDSEFDHIDLTTVPSQVVKAPRVAESPVAFECRTMQIVPIGTFNLVIGQVVHWFVRDDLIDENHHVDTQKLAPIGRMAGNNYCYTERQFTIPNGLAN